MAQYKDELTEHVCLGRHRDVVHVVVISADYVWLGRYSVQHLITCKDNAMYYFHFIFIFCANLKYFVCLFVAYLG